MNLAVIPARGGSKRIPRKNIKAFAGKPIIAYSIEAALRSELFQDVVVSTDDSEIADIAKQFGASVPFMRPPELADDYAGTLEVIAHAITEISRLWRTQPDYTCCIYATAPLIQVQDIVQGYNLLKTKNKYYAFPVTSFSFPVQRAIKFTDDGAIEPFYPEYQNTRSQDLEPAYHDAGQFYWGKSDAFLSMHSMDNDHAIPIPIPRYRVQDIDTEEDWKQAEILYTCLKPTFRK
ncbi:MAG: pseudaminic acid cytidylyltransferase [Candidatus Electrothrix sp. Rat3]|nr:pseudaminic acid cytidylyltransferase [Candidatus Electrothrix rattekaaiensis]